MDLEDLREFLLKKWEGISSFSYWTPGAHTRATECGEIAVSGKQTLFFRKRGSLETFTETSVGDLTEVRGTQSREFTIRTLRVFDGVHVFMEISGYQEGIVSATRSVVDEGFVFPTFPSRLFLDAWGRNGTLELLPESLADDSPAFCIRKTFRDVPAMFEEAVGDRVFYFSRETGLPFRTDQYRQDGEILFREDFMDMLINEDDGPPFEYEPPLGVTVVDTD